MRAKTSSEESRVRLGVADFCRDDDGIEERPESGAVQAAVLHVRDPVGHQRHAELAVQRVKQFRRTIEQLRALREMTEVAVADRPGVDALLQAPEPLDAQVLLRDLSGGVALPQVRLDRAEVLEQGGPRVEVRLDPGARQCAPLRGVVVEQGAVGVEKDPAVRHGPMLLLGLEFACRLRVQSAGGPQVHARTPPSPHAA